MGQPMDYDSYAHEYAETRWPFPWIVEPLNRLAALTSEGASILEVGCGTGNYIIALAERDRYRTYRGFDLSAKMLAVAQSRSRIVEFLRADAERRFPYEDQTFGLVYLVDVIHHIENMANLFTEAARVSKAAGWVVIVTDSEENICERSLTRFFPELLELELKRYPRLDELHAAAGSAGLALDQCIPAEGQIELDDKFIAKLERKGSSGMRLMAPEAHAQGIQRVRAASLRGERWFSCYTVLSYRRTQPIPS